QTLAQSLSATPPAASDPKAPFSLPPSTLENNLDPSLNTPSFPFGVECCADLLRPPPKADIGPDSGQLSPTPGTCRPQCGRLMMRRRQALACASRSTCR